MKDFVGATILILTLYMFGFSQTPAKVAMPVPGAKPVVMTSGDFENLEYAASMDRFGEVNDKELKIRLDRFASIISKENRTIEYVILLNNKKHTELGSKLEVIYKYLTGAKKLATSRFSFALTMESENSTELWLVPVEKLAIPGCDDCVIIPADDNEKLKEFFQVRKSN